MKTDLLDAYLTGDLQGDSAAFIEAALKSDAALREVYFQQVRMDAALRVLLEDEELAEVSPDRFAGGVMATLRGEEQPEVEETDRRLAKSVLMEILDERDLKPRPMGWWELVKAAGIAAAAVAAAVVIFQQVSLSDSDPRSGAGTAMENRFVARVTSQQQGTTWGEPASLAEVSDNSSPIVSEEGWMRPGRFTLEKGVAEVTFNSGARVYLEGPAVLDVERPDRAFLQRGRLTAEVPKPATGFVINTPRVNVVDIGTRFGVSVEDSGDTEVHVMQGLVEVSRLTGNGVPMLVEEGLAIRADSRTRSELQVIEYAGDSFALRVTNPAAEPAANPLRFLHYDFDESGSDIEDRGLGIEGGPFPASLFPDPDLPPHPQRSVGRSGGGLAFELGERFDSPLLSGFGSGEPLTVSLWVRIPPRPESQASHTILRLLPLSSDASRESSTSNGTAGWQMGWNSRSEDGTPGALRIDTGNGFLIGTTDLRDGRWHHVGFQFVGGSSPALESHVHLYVDGRIEDISGMLDTESPSIPLRLLQVGGSEGESGFEGMIDDVHVFPDAVTPNVLQKLASEEPSR